MNKTANYLKIFIGIFVFLIIQGCVTLDKSLDDNRIIINKENLNKINGCYSNYSCDSVIGYYVCMWGMFSNWETYPSDWRDLKVKIDIVSEKCIKVSLIRSENIVRTKRIHGKFQDGCFYCRDKFMIYPFFPFAFGYSNEKSRLTFLDDSIIVEISSNVWVFVTFSGTDGKGYITYRFKKIN